MKCSTQHATKLPVFVHFGDFRLVHDLLSDVSLSERKKHQLWIEEWHSRREIEMLR